MVIQSSLMSHYSIPRYPFLLADLIFFLDLLGNIVLYLFCKRFFFLLSLLWWSRLKWTVIFFLSLMNCMITRFTIDSWVLNFTVYISLLHLWSDKQLYPLSKSNNSLNSGVWDIVKWLYNYLFITMWVIVHANYLNFKSK